MLPQLDIPFFFINQAHLFSEQGQINALQTSITGRERKHACGPFLQILIKRMDLVLLFFCHYP